ncbi:MAG: hypothetical protein AAF846_06235 [Chloroflexota bacterium]
MGVKLDWDIEAEKGKRNEHREDSEQRKRRYGGVFRLFLTVAIFASILGSIAYLVFQRYEQVTQYTEQLLVDTVQAEVASLRGGDLIAFEERQRSATDDWSSVQREVYNAYQTLKVESSVVLSGNVTNIEIDGQRARVQVEEIIDGVPFVQTWFYWRYEDGWFHVPPDYTFWGENDSIETDNYIIRYGSVDVTTAQQIENSLERWLSDTCSLFDCSTIPLITVDILPAPNADVRWADNEQNAWQMVVPSPYTERARADIPFDTQLQIDTATLLAQRIVSQASNNTQALPTSDASYLQETTTAWLVGRFVQLNPETHFIQSLVDNYGAETVTRILQNVQATSSLSLVASVTGVATIPELQVDWRDYVLWRLNLEDSLISNNDETAWVSLYDFTDLSVRDQAYQRFTSNFVASSRTVESATIATSEAGLPQLVALVNVTRGFESGQEVVVFNLINGNWLRAN